MKKFKKNEGITLITLVVTIIVVLLLAAISLTIINNSVLIKKVDLSKKIYNKEEAKEKLNLVLVQLQAEKYTNKKYNESTYIDNVLSDNKFVVDGNNVTIGNWTFKIDRTVPMIVAEKESVSEGGSVDIENTRIVSALTISKNPQKYYGREVEYTTENTVKTASLNNVGIKLASNADAELEEKGITWKIFYADDNNIYLIASEVLSDGVYFEDSEDTLKYMLTKSNWSKYVGSTAEYATGGPTFTMFLKSWNGKYPENAITNYTGNEEDGFSCEDNTDITDSLYLNKIGWGYWLASRAVTINGRNENYLVHCCSTYYNDEGERKGFIYTDEWAISGSVINNLKAIRF